MAPLKPGGVLPLVTSVAAAAALSGVAVFAVLGSGCDDPGVYRVHGGVVELVGGCLDRADLPRTPPRQSQTGTRPSGTDNTSLTP